VTDEDSPPPCAEHPLLLHDTLQSSYPQQEAQQQLDWQEASDKKNDGFWLPLSSPVPVIPGFSAGFCLLAAAPFPPTASRSVQNTKRAMTLFIRICTS